MKLAIGIPATASYTYALPSLIRHILANVTLAEVATETTIILAGDHNPDLEEAWNEIVAWRNGVQVRKLQSDLADGEENYKPRAQQIIAQLKQQLANEAMAIGADYLWMLDSDVLPKANSLRCMLQMLQFDGGYYEVAFCPYPTQGLGRTFLSGRGTLSNPILPNVYPEELELTKEDKKKDKELRKAMFEAVKAGDKARIEEASQALRDHDEEIRTVRMPKGNVYQLNATRWRRRGWFDYAYPAIGRGAVVPVDWVGFGNTLMSKRALTLCEWTGYSGEGTEDLFVIWARWQEAGIRLCSIPHCPADHVIRTDVENAEKMGLKVEPNQEGKVILHVRSYHDQSEEYEGHLRTIVLPFFQHYPGEPLRPAKEASVHKPKLVPPTVDSPPEA